VRRAPRERLEDVGSARGDDDEIRVRRLRRPRQLLDRGAHPEVVDSPALTVEHDPEDHQREVVQLQGRAREHSLWPASAAPSAGQAGQPAADDEAGEVLLRDACGAVPPARAEVAEVGHDDVAQDGRQ
jgi:hypothetical protein